MAEETLRAYDPIRYRDYALDRTGWESMPKDPLGWLSAFMAGAQDAAPGVTQARVDPLEVAALMKTTPAPMASELSKLITRLTPELRHAWRRVGGSGRTDLEALHPGSTAIPFGVKPSGTQDLTEVLKLYRGHPVIPVSDPIKFIPPRDVVNTAVNVQNKTLPLLPTLEMGSLPSQEMHWIVQPYAKTVTESQFPDVLKDIYRRLPKNWHFWDAAPRNVGIYQGTPYVIDPGALMLRQVVR